MMNISAGLQRKNLNAFITEQVGIF